MSGLPGAPVGVSFPDELVEQKGTGWIKPYAEELVAEHGPGPGYAAVKALCLERARRVGAWPGMPALLRRFAAGAGADAEAEDDEVVAELVVSGVLWRAAAPVWRSYAAAVARAVAGDALLRDRLLEPPPKDAQRQYAFYRRRARKGIDIRRAGMADVWIGLLADTGEALRVASGPAAARTEWLAGTLHALTHQWRSTNMGLVQGSAPVPERLGELLAVFEVPGPRPVLRVSDGVDDVRYLDVLLTRGWSVELDGGLSTSGWAADPPAVRSPLAALLADPVFADHLLDAAATRVWQKDRGLWDPAEAPPALREVTGRVQARAIAVALGRLADMPLSEWSPTLGRDQPLPILETLTDAGFPADLAPLVSAADPARPLTELLRGGLVDEFGWPALEAAAARFGPDVQLAGAWPDLVLHDSRSAVLVGRDGVLAEYQLPDLGPDATSPRVFFADGELLVHTGPDGPAAWTHQPDDVFHPPKPDGSSPDPWEPTLPLPDGGRTTGLVDIRPGDRVLPAVRWRTTLLWYRRHGADPELGTTVRQGEHGWISVADDPDSPLRIGSWVVGEQNGQSLRGTGLEPGEVRRPLVRALPADGAIALSWPGSDVQRTLHWVTNPSLFAPVTWSMRIWLRLPGAGDLAKWFEPGEPHPLAAGTPCFPPPLYWQHMRVRDAAGSAALRTIERPVVRRLLDAAVADHRAGDADHPRATAALAAELPQVTHPGLRAGLLGVLGVAADLDARLADAVARPVPG